MAQTPRYDADSQPPHDRDHQDDRDQEHYPAPLADRVSGSQRSRRPAPSARPRQRPARLHSLVGTLPGRSGVIAVIGSTALGALATVIGGGQPGTALFLLTIAGTVVGGTVVRPRASYLIIPVPALAYLVAALGAGAINEEVGGASSAQLAVGVLQWLAHGFVAMTSATVLAIGIAAARWWLAMRRDRRHG